MANSLSYNEAVALSLRYKKFLPASYNMQSPQWLLTNFIFHKEGRMCLGCKYHYSGHAEGLAMSNAIWEHTNE